MGASVREFLVLTLPLATTARARTSAFTVSPASRRAFSIEATAQGGLVGGTPGRRLDLDRRRPRRRWRATSSPLVGEEGGNVGRETRTTGRLGGMRILGVCGGIGSGKSTACGLMVDSLGCAACIDADKLAHEAYEPGSAALERIASTFGEEIVLAADGSGRIDRKKLGGIVFADPEAMLKLEEIVWPYLRTLIEGRINDIAAKRRSEESPPSSRDHEESTDGPNGDIVVVEAALLLEAGWDDLLDGLWVVSSSRTVAMRRLAESRGMSEEDAAARMRAQEGRGGIFARADSDDDGPVGEGLRRETERGGVTAVIVNDGSLAELEGRLAGALADRSSFRG